MTTPRTTRGRTLLTAGVADRPGAFGRVVPPGRVVGLDVARCLALLGMIGTHTLARDEPGFSAAVHDLAGGRASALFAVLAGASMALMSGRSTPVRGRDGTRVAARLAVRAVLVALGGLALGELDTTVAVILTYYGLLFLLGVPFLRLGWRPLLALAGAWTVLGPVVAHLVRPQLPAPSYASPSFASLEQPWQLVTELTFTGYYPAVPWLAYLLAGMALGRLDLGRLRTGLALAGGGLLVAVVSHAVSRLLLDVEGVRGALVRTLEGPGADRLAGVLDEGLYGTTPTGTWWWLAVSSPHTGTPFDLAHTTGSSAAVIGVALLAAAAAPRVLAVVFGAGAMTLSLYSLHVVLLTPDLWPEDAVRTFAKHVAVVLAVGAGYRLAGRSGPLERLVAAVSGAVVPSPRGAEAASSRSR